MTDTETQPASFTRGLFARAIHDSLVFPYPPTLDERSPEEAAVIRRIAVRYLGEREGSAYAATAGERGVVIRLEPGELRTWDFADDFAG